MEAADKRKQPEQQTQPTEANAAKTEHTRYITMDVEGEGADLPLHQPQEVASGSGNPVNYNIPDF